MPLDPTIDFPVHFLQSPDLLESRPFDPSPSGIADRAEEGATPPQVHNHGGIFRPELISQPNARCVHIRGERSMNMDLDDLAVRARNARGSVGGGEKRGMPTEERRPLLVGPPFQGEHPAPGVPHGLTPGSADDSKPGAGRGDSGTRLRGRIGQARIRRDELRRWITVQATSSDEAGWIEDPLGRRFPAFVRGGDPDPRFLRGHRPQQEEATGGQPSADRPERQGSHGGVPFLPVRRVRPRER